MPDITPAVPFTHDADYLEAELAWVRARCRTLGALREIAADTDQRPGRRTVTVVGDEELTGTADQRRRAASLKAVEEGLRRDIDARLAATRRAGVTVGLDQVCAQYGLNEVERTTLLLVLAPCLGTYWADELSLVGPYGLSLGLGSPTVETALAFGEARFEVRLGMCRDFDGSSRLVRSGLVIVEPGRTAHPGDWPGATLTLTTKGFAAITGVEVHDHETCPACGHPVAS